MPQIPDPLLPNATGPLAVLTAALVKYLRLIQAQVNALSSGSVSASIVANSGPPVAAGNTKIYAKGDFIQNNNPSVLGSAGSQYVITGWICIAGGTPGTWVACHSLTGT
jgi:hypothetical protein